MSWRGHLRERGYAILPERASPALVDAANAAIDHDLAASYDPDRQLEYDHRSYCPGLRRAPELLDLLGVSAARDAVDELLGWERLRGTDHAQIAIRRARNAEAPVAPEWHIDGVATAHNGVRGRSLDSFTALVGIFLTRTAVPFAGNFTVWPGSHEVIAGWFRERGRAALREGMPAVDPGEPAQLLVEPGDVVVASYALAHAAAVNTSDDERRAVFFRLALRDLPRRRWERLADPWDGWRAS
jgi:hypothetical protein